MSATTSTVLNVTPSQPKRRRRRLNWYLIALLALFSSFAFVGVFAHVLVPQDPHQQELIARLRPPAWQTGGTWTHPLGTDGLGRDELSRLIAGARISLIVVAIAIPASVLIGTTIGLIAGFRSGLLGTVLMRVVDIQLALPAILFAVLLAAKFGPGLGNVLFVIIAWNWAGFARVVRAEVLALRERDFLLAARCTGGSDLWIIFRHVVPNVVNTVVVLATLDISAVVLAEASLSFLGVGVHLGTASWGGMISEGSGLLSVASWLVWVPGTAILLLALTGNLLGDALRDALEPKSRR